MEIKIKPVMLIGDLYSMGIDFRFPTNFRWGISSSFNFANASWRFELFCDGNEMFDLHLVRLSSHVPSQTIIINIWQVFDNDECIVCSKEVILSTLNNNQKVFQYLCCSDRLFCSLVWKKSKEVDATSQTEMYEEIKGPLASLTWDEKRNMNAATKTENYEEKKGSYLCQDLKKMLLNGQGHDLILKVGDKEFRAHQDILRFRSEVFDSMLSHDMIEKNSGVIDVPDCDPQAFEQFLVYVYSGEVETLDQSNMLGLYYAADKYDMIRLKEVCCEFIKKSLSANNICDVIKLSLKHSDSSLLGHATEYFVNNLKDILPTVEWQCFLKNCTTQANELLIKSTNKWYDPKV